MAATRCGTIFSLPFLFDSEAHLRRVLDARPGERVLASLVPHGMVGLCFYDSGARSFYNTRGPIERPADMSGMKMASTAACSMTVR